MRKSNDLFKLQKSQLSIEFIFLTAVFILVGVVIVNVYYETMNNSLVLNAIRSSVEHFCVIHDCKFSKVELKFRDNNLDVHLYKVFFDDSLRNNLENNIRNDINDLTTKTINIYIH